MDKAIFPGSFDPFTIGHMDVLHSALQLFDSIIIAVGCNSMKKGLFDTNTRVSIIEDAIAAAGLSNVSVCTYSNLTIDFCREIGVNCIVRGLRTTTDFEFENVIAQANKKIAPEISTIFIPASGEYSFISSTVVRDIILHKGDVSDFLPKGVEIGKYTKNIY